MADSRIPALLFLSLLSTTVVSRSLDKISLLHDLQQVSSRDIDIDWIPERETDDDRPSYIIDHEDQHCILARMKASITLTYKTKQGLNKTVTVPVPDNASYDGACEGDSIDYVPGPRLEFRWKWDPNNTKYESHNVNFQFRTTDEGIFLQYAEAFFNPNDTQTFPEIDDTNTELEADVLVNYYNNTHKSESFTCNSEKEFFNPKRPWSVKFEDVKFQIGKNLPDTFGWGRQCEETSTERNTPSYILENDQGICFLASMELSFNVTYKDEQDESKQVVIQVPRNATTQGACPSSSSGSTPDFALYLQWWWDSADTSNDEPHLVSVRFRFSDRVLFIYGVTASLNPNDTSAFPQIQDIESNIYFDVPVNDYRLADRSQSFTCNPEKQFSDQNKPDQPSVILKNVRFQEGKNLPNSFGPGPTCPRPSTNTNDPFYIINNGDSNCFLLRMNMTVSIPYQTTKGVNRTATIQLPDDAPYSGACKGYSFFGTPGPAFIFEWNWDPTVTDQDIHLLEVQFKNDSDQVFIASVSGLLNPNDTNFFPDIKDTISSIFFDIDVHDYFISLSDTSESLTCESEKVFHSRGEKAELKLQNVQIQMGENLPDTFGPGSDCEEDLTKPTYILYNGEDICFLARMKISITVPYQTEEGFSFSTTVHVPDDATLINGECLEENQGAVMQIVWKWDPTNTDEERHKLLAVFKGHTEDVFLQYMSGFLNPNDTNIFPGINDTDEYINFDVTIYDYYLTDKSKSFTCDVKRNFYNQEKQDTLTLEGVQIQVGDDLSTTFTPGPSCYDDNPTTSSSTDPTPGLPPYSTPQPEVDDDKPSFVINDGINTCLLASMKLSFQIPYLTTTIQHAMLSVPETAEFTGACEGGYYEHIPGPVLVLRWEWTTAHPSAFGYHYAKIIFNSSAEGTKIQSVNAEFDAKDSNTFPLADTFLQPVIEFQIPVDDYYLTDDSESFTCNTKKTFDDGAAHVELENVKFQVGDNINDTEKFASGASCAEDDDDNTVAIAVGVTVPLVAIIVIGGIVYWKFWK